MAKLAVLAIHGIGTTRRGYSEKLKAHLRRALGKESDEVCFVEIDYQNHLQDNQDRLWERVRRGLRWTSLRRFLLFYWFCQNWLSRESERTLHLPDSPETPGYIPPTAAINACVLLR